MDRFKFTTIAHRHHRLCSPISDDRLDQLIERLQLDSHSTVLDVATGKAELAIRIIERYGCRVTGVDVNPSFLAEAAEQAARRVSPDRLELVETDGATFDAPHESFDLACCLGARPFGDYPATLTRLKQWVKPGGLILIGEGCWQTKPSPDLLSYLDCTEDAYNDHKGNQELAISQGLTPQYAAIASDAEFDHYNRLYVATMLCYLREHPDDPDAAEMRERIESLHDAYERWMRGTLGFAIYLFSKDATVAARRNSEP